MKGPAIGSWQETAFCFAVLVGLPVGIIIAAIVAVNAGIWGAGVFFFGLMGLARYLDDV